MGIVLYIFFCFLGVFCQLTCSANTVVPAFARVGRQALDRLDEVANSPECLKRIALKRGEAIIADNYRWLHGRDGFEDAAGEIGGRLLIRLWLQLDSFGS